MWMNLLGFILAILILVGVHEWGHFYVARLCGVRVLRFSIGIGRVLWSFKDKKGTEFALSLFPIGGYVSMLGEKNADLSQSPISKADEAHSFRHKPLWQRIAIIAAGPLINFVFAILIYAAIFMGGTEKIAPVLGPVPEQTVAYAAGFRGGEEILKLNSAAINSWEELLVKLYGFDFENEKAELIFEVRSQANAKEKIKQEIKALHMPALALKNILQNLSTGEDPLSQLGLIPWEPVDLSIDGFIPELAAAQSGLKVGDHVLAINGQAVKSRMDLIQKVKAHAGQVIDLKISRGLEAKSPGYSESLESLELKAFKIQVSEKGLLGIKFKKLEIPEGYIRIQHYTPWEALKAGYLKTAEYARLTLKMLADMLQGLVSSKQLGGPISIAQQAGTSIEYGWVYFANFLALLSVSLGVLNLLPIPVLDGGEICMNCIQSALKSFEQKFSPGTSAQLSSGIFAKIQGAFSAFGVSVIILVSLLALYNDFSRLNFASFSGKISAIKN
ncbi:MAG: RIP metalloprotease RseP [Gammaproteobacteria bacterium]